jgi:hypothetical protein
MQHLFHCFMTFTIVFRKHIEMHNVKNRFQIICSKEGQHVAVGDVFRSVIEFVPKEVFIEPRLLKGVRI